MRCARVPDEEVSGLGAELLPLQALVLQPLHAGIREAVPLASPENNFVNLELIAKNEIGNEIGAGCSGRNSRLTKPIFCLAH